MEYQLNADNFDNEVLKSDEPFLVDFYADWCGPCKMMGPVVEELAREWDGRIKVGKLNIDSSDQVAARYRVMSIPTFILFKDGQPVETLVGGMTKKELKERIESRI